MTVAVLVGIGVMATIIILVVRRMLIKLKKSRRELETARQQGPPPED